jgi:flavodoxin
MFEVVYLSKRGSTRKVAQAIAKELGVVAKDIETTGDISKGTIVFLGTGNYGGMDTKPIIQFIENNKQQLKHIALFGTSAGGVGSEITRIERILTKHNIAPVGRFYCKGKFLFLRRNNPTNEELEQARIFARKIADTVH